MNITEHRLRPLKTVESCVFACCSLWSENLMLWIKLLKPTTLMLSFRFTCMD